MMQKPEKARPVARHGSTSEHDSRVIELYRPLNDIDFRICDGCISAECFNRGEGVQCWHPKPCVGGSEHLDRFGRMKNKNGRLPTTSGPISSACDVCGRLVCRNRSSAIIRCNEFVSMELMQRTMRDEPPNERILRGRC